jgi:pimeloyl-ACP methyl ester carboxylesterase
MRGIFIALFACVLGGCVATAPVNPSFPVTMDQGRAVLKSASDDPKPLDRPLVIIGGFFDPGIAAGALARDFRRYTRDDRIVSVSLDFSFDEEDYRRRIIQAVDKAFPSSDPILTTEVDVIGYSMGGLAARYAAITPPPGRRLRINRLFTISSPHNGAVAAHYVPIDLVDLQEQMTPGSPFLNAINNTADPNALYPIYAYVCLGDHEVGEGNAAPRTQIPWWLSRPAFISAHVWAYQDPRIRADIVRRLRDETPLSTDPPAPLPTQKNPSRF